MNHIFENLDTIDQAMSQHDRKMASLLNLARTVFDEPWKYKVTGSHITMLSSEQIELHEVGGKQTRASSSDMARKPQIRTSSRKTTKNKGTALKREITKKNRETPSLEKTFCKVIKSLHHKKAKANNEDSCDVKPKDSMLHASKIRRAKTGPKVNRFSESESSSSTLSRESDDCELRGSLDLHQMRNIAFRHKSHPPIESYGYDGNLPKAHPAEVSRVNPSRIYGGKLGEADPKADTVSLCSPTGRSGSMPPDSDSSAVKQGTARGEGRIEGDQDLHYELRVSLYEASIDALSNATAEEYAPQERSNNSTSASPDETLVDTHFSPDASCVLMKTVPDYKNETLMLHPKRNYSVAEAQQGRGCAGNDDSAFLYTNSQTEELSADGGCQRASMALNDFTTPLTWLKQSKHPFCIQQSCFERLAIGDREIGTTVRSNTSTENVSIPQSSFAQFGDSGTEKEVSDDRVLESCDSLQSSGVSEEMLVVTLGSTQSQRPSRGKSRMEHVPQLSEACLTKRCLETTEPDRLPDMNQTYLVSGADTSCLLHTRNEIRSDTSPSKARISTNVDLSKKPVISILKPSRLCVNIRRAASTEPKNKTKRGKVVKNAVSRKAESKRKLAKLLSAEHRHPSRIASVKQITKERIPSKHNGELATSLEDARHVVLSKMHLNGFTSKPKNRTNTKIDADKAVWLNSGRIFTKLSSSSRPSVGKISTVNQTENGPNWSRNQATHVSPEENRPTREVTFDADSSVAIEETLASSHASKTDHVDDVHRGKANDDGINAVSEPQKKTTRPANCSSARTEKTPKNAKSNAAPRKISARTEEVEEAEGVNLLRKSPPLDLESAVQAVTASVTLRRSGRLINKANTFPNPAKSSKPSPKSRKAETAPAKRKTPRRVVSAEVKSASSGKLQDSTKIFKPNNKTTPSSGKENRNRNPKNSVLETSRFAEVKTARTPKVESRGRKNAIDPKLDAVDARQTQNKTPKADTECVKNAARYPNQDLKFMFKSLTSKTVRDPKKPTQTRNCF